MGQPFSCAHSFSQSRYAYVVLDGEETGLAIVAALNQLQQYLYIVRFIA
jgi:hypothetical protein